MQEVVAGSFKGSSAPAKLPQATAPHVTPQRFHDILAEAEKQPERETVLLDVRNHYETRVGCFHRVRSPSVVPTTAA